MASSLPPSLPLPSAVVLLLLLISSASFLPLRTVSRPPPPPPPEKEKGDGDYVRWVRWNVESFRRRAAHPNSDDDASGGSGLDMRLAKAEASRVVYSISQDGGGDFPSIREALAAVPANNARRVVLAIKPGNYREKVVIPKTMPFITFVGDASDPPLLTGNNTAATRWKNGKAMETFHSATVAVNGDYFMAVNIVFENTAPYPEKGAKGGQAVALRISGNKAALHGCRFLGAQDTLYDHRGLHYFKNCFIQGATDFVFGYGRSLYESCYLNSITKRVASLTAQKRSRRSMDSGFSFVNGTVAGSGPVYLGRAWGDSSRVVFSYTFMDKVVVPQGWSGWRVRRPESSGVYYGEYRCSGPGAEWSGRVNWSHQLTDEEAKPFLGTHFIEGDTWLLDPASAAPA